MRNGRGKDSKEGTETRAHALSQATKSKDMQMTVVDKIDNLFTEPSNFFALIRMVSKCGDQVLQERFLQFLDDFSEIVKYADEQEALKAKGVAV
jgi:Asp-tRNA(Asn)/Glu-tRNA(Gln) amidotransferase C subunit